MSDALQNVMNKLVDRFIDENLSEFTSAITEFGSHGSSAVYVDAEGKVKHISYKDFTECQDSPVRT